MERELNSDVLPQGGGVVHRPGHQAAPALRSATIIINGTTQTFPPAILADQRHILDVLGLNTGLLRQMS
jgi:hypothetical protein